MLSFTRQLGRRLLGKMGLATSRKYRAFEVGFHGDKHLLQLVQALLNRSSYFIETGANVGSTLNYVARNHPQVNCIACEPDEKAYGIATNGSKALPNVTIYKLTSQQFLKQLSTNPMTFFDQTALFWLDAHGYGYEWPLADEIAFITQKFAKGYILVDDFEVPGKDQFAFLQYKGQVCNFAYLRPALNSKRKYALYYPDYTERTSKHHPLIGWGLILFGDIAVLKSALTNDLQIIEV